MRQHLEASIPLEVEAAWQHWDAATQSLKILDSGVLRQSEKNLEVIRQAYALGQLRLLDVLNEQRRLIDTRMTYIDAESDVRRGFIELERAVGGEFEMKDVLMVVALCLALASCSKPKPEASPEKGRKRQIPGLVTMEPAAQQHVGMKISPAKVTQLTEYLQVTGTVQPVDSRVGQVRSLARGRLLEVRAKVGDRVRAGQELARIDNLEAGELTAQLSSARAELQRFKSPGGGAGEAGRSEIRSSPKSAPRRAKDYEQSRAEHQALEESAAFAGSGDRRPRRPAAAFRQVRSGSHRGRGDGRSPLPSMASSRRP